MHSDGDQVIISYIVNIDKKNKFIGAALSILI